MGAIPPSRVLGHTFIQGGEDVLDNANFFEENGLTHVVGVCHRTVDTSLVPSIHDNNVRWFDLDDAPSAAETLASHLPETTLFIHEARINGGNVYVHCAAGISRSSTVSLAYFMTWLDIELDDCIRFLKAARKEICPNQGFYAKLKEWERSTRRRELRESMLAEHPDERGLLEHDLQHIFRLLNNAGPSCIKPLKKIGSDEVIDVPTLAPEEPKLDSDDDGSDEPDDSEEV